MANLIVGAGATRIITKSEEVLLVQNWTMGDNSRISFAPEVTSWKIIAKRLSFGANVVIEGSGADGSPGADAPAVAPTPGGLCKPGNNGKAGDPGIDGKDGIPLDINVGIDSMGSLAVRSVGGKGGKGGNGQPGSSGGRGDCGDMCSGGNGGNGGNGGLGGHGGNGGNITFAFKLLGATPSPAPEDLVSLFTEAGIGGPGGIGSKAHGSGGAGRRCSYGRRSKGRSGSPGRDGQEGRHGRDGVADFDELSDDYLLTFDKFAEVSKQKF